MPYGPEYVESAALRSGGTMGARSNKVEGCGFSKVALRLEEKIRSTDKDSSMDVGGKLSHERTNSAVGGNSWIGSGASIARKRPGLGARSLMGLAGQGS